VPPQSVTLLVLSDSGTPVNQPPVARATATPASGTAPLAVSFDGRTSSDPDGSIASHAWTFGDGVSASGSTASHTYSAAGTYTARLTVTDNQGATGTTTVVVSVAAGLTPPPAPSNLGASVSGKTVTLTWKDNAANETGVYVERAVKAKTLQYSRIATLGANVTTYARTETSDTWTYRVQAYNSVGVSAYSNVVTVRVR